MLAHSWHGYILYAPAVPFVNFPDAICHTHAGLLRFQHDDELLFIREAAPVRAAVVWRIRFTCRCQVVFRRAILSSAASTSACLRAGTRMKMRPPVDLHLGVLKTVPPFGS